MRILYGISGEGMGHAVRSKPLIQELEKNHKVWVVSGDRAYSYLNRFFNVTKIGCFNIIYRKNSVNYFLTFFSNLLKLPFIALYNLRLVGIMLRFNPDLIITDLEPFSCYLALIFGKKCISIDNQHIIHTKMDIPILDRLIIRLMVIKADYYFVTTFFYPSVIRKNTFLFPPINRENVLKAKPKKKDYILVYQTSKSDRQLLIQLHLVDENFIVYGLNKNVVLGNVRLKKFNGMEFVRDMADCKAVICNGGFTVIGEALYLGKPILSIPVKKQFEQIRNAYYLNKLKYGICCREITKRNIEDFISDLPKYRKALKDYRKEDNKKIIEKLNNICNE